MQGLHIIITKNKSNSEHKMKKIEKYQQTHSNKFDAKNIHGTRI